MRRLCIDTATQRLGFDVPSDEGSRRTATAVTS
jgi:hypothetical protein